MLFLVDLTIEVQTYNEYGDRVHVEIHPPAYEALEYPSIG